MAEISKITANNRKLLTNHRLISFSGKEEETQEEGKGGD